MTTESTPPSDLDLLMSRDPTDLSSLDIDRIIAYHRDQRVRRASGEKPARPSAAPARDMSDIMAKLIKKPASTSFTRRV
jgi:hypothetical protein